MNSQTPMDRHGPATKDREREPLRRDAAVRTVTSQELFRGTHEIAIEHSGSFYRLKITRQGKLILNK